MHRAQVFPPKDTKMTKKLKIYEQVPSLGLKFTSLNPQVKYV